MSFISIFILFLLPNFFHLNNLIKGCPYFRTLFNVPKCVVRTRSEFEKRLKSEEEQTFIEELTGRRRLINENLIFWILIPILLSLLSVISFGTIFFLQGLKSTKGRFEVVPGV